jgi:DNA polymerase-3 subunit gamma/tau
MSYKSLYRKYRPMRFEDVCGQQFIVKTLSNAIKNNKIGHAYLFCGTRGTGKTTIAKIFAKLVNCLNPLDNVPCGECEICLNENTDEIPDIIEIDAASNNGVDEIRELKNKIKLMPVMCKYKVYIIDEVHMLSTGAFNALLKTLEEPPEHVIFILATTEPQKLPITIISRCQRFDFKKINVLDISKRLKYISQKEGIDIDDEAIEEIAKLSEGAMRDAIGLLDQISSFADSKITVEDIYTIRGSVSNRVLIELIEKYIDNDASSILSIVDDIYLSGKDFYRLSEDILVFYRNMLISKVAPSYFEDKALQLKEDIMRLSSKIEVKRIERMIKKLEELLRNIKSSDYPRILFETTILSDLDLDESFENEKTTTEKDKTFVMGINEVDSKSKNKEIKLDKNINEIIKEEFKEKDIKKVTTKNKSNNSFAITDALKEAMINNTIAEASASLKKEATVKFEELDKYLIDKDFKAAATILKDSIVTAVSNDHMLLTYKYESMVEDNDNEYASISNLIKQMFGSEYKVVAITDKRWKELRPYFLNLKKENGTIPLIEEKYEKINKSENMIENENYEEVLNIFDSDLIEMEE